MTTLTRPVVRKCSRTAEQGRPIIVALEPGDVIALRQKGRRGWYRLTVSSVFWSAVKADAREKAREKAARRKARGK